MLGKNRLVIEKSLHECDIPGLPSQNQDDHVI